MFYLFASELETCLEQPLRIRRAHGLSESGILVLEDAGTDRSRQLPFETIEASLFATVLTTAAAFDAVNVS